LFSGIFEAECTIEQSIWYNRSLRKNAIFLVFTRFVGQVSAPDQGLCLAYGVGDFPLAQHAGQLVGGASRLVRRMGERAGGVVAPQGRAIRLEGRRGSAHAVG
jgi:hypothetical protein